MFQDIVSIKTTLLKLKRVLQQVYRKGWLLMYFMNFINIKKRHNIFVCFIWYVYQCASVLTRTLLFFSFIIVINHDFIFKSEENGLTRVCFLLHILFWYYSFFFFPYYTCRIHIYYYRYYLINIITRVQLCFYNYKILNNLYYVHR